MQLCEMHVAEGLIILVLSLIINYIKWFKSISKSIDWFLYDRDLRLWLFICCKTKLKKKIFFFICFLQNIRYLQKKMFLYVKKKFIEKNINENVKKIYLISEIYFYTENVCVTNKIKIFLKYIFILQKKFFWS